MIYFIETQGLVKIGYSNDPKRRFQMLATGCPTECTLIAVCEGDMTLEKSIHEKFKHLRLRGEWFAFTPEINGFISAHAVPVAANDEVQEAETAHPLAQYLNANGIGVAEFGQKVGLSRFQVWRIIRGESTTIDTMFRIVEATDGDVSVEDFMEVWASQRKSSKAKQPEAAQ